MYTGSSLPRGFSRDRLLPGREEERGPLMHSQPTSSFITVYLPNPEIMTEKAVARDWYEILLFAWLEETLHSSMNGVGGVRNMYLLEQKSRDALFCSNNRSNYTTKSEIIRCELACEQLYDGMVDLIETHEKFQLRHELRVFSELAEISHQEPTLLWPLAQSFDVNDKILVDIIPQMASASLKDDKEVNNQVLDGLVKLHNEVGTLDIPRLCVALALDIPYFIDPLSSPVGTSVQATKIDFIDRFTRIMEAFCTDAAIRRFRDYDLPPISRSRKHYERLQLIDVAKEVVNRHSTVPISDNVPYVTTQNLRFPLLTIPTRNAMTKATKLQLMINRFQKSDLYGKSKWNSRPFDIIFKIVSEGIEFIDDMRQAILLEMNGGRQILQYSTNFFSEWQKDVIDMIVKTLYGSYGGIAINDIVLLRNPYIYTKETESSIYGWMWEQEFVYMSLIEQLLQCTIDDDNSSIRNPFDAFDDFAPEVSREWSEHIGQVEKIVDEFAAIEVDEEGDLRKYRKRRHKNT